MDSQGKNDNTQDNSEGTKAQPLAVKKQPVRRTPVASSNIMSIGFDEAENKLVVEFKGGGVYEYSGVLKPIYESLMKADSKGKAFATMIKNKYAFKKVPNEGSQDTNYQENPVPQTK